MGWVRPTFCRYGKQRRNDILDLERFFQSALGGMSWASLEEGLHAASSGDTMELRKTL